MVGSGLGGTPAQQYTASPQRPVILEASHGDPIFVDCRLRRVRFVIDPERRMDGPTRRHVAALLACAITVSQNFTAWQVPGVKALDLAVRRLLDVDPNLLYQDLLVEESEATVDSHLRSRLDFNQLYDGWLIEVEMPMPH